VTAFRPENLDFTKGDGFVTVIAQDAATGTVLMTARADREALARSVETGELHFHSRARGLWHKGSTSGNYLRVVSLHADCDGDAVLAVVAPTGPACHEGRMSCFAGDHGGAALRILDGVIAARAAALKKADPIPGYTTRLLGDRNLRLKKIGEEALEFSVAVADGDRSAAVEEAADLIYHVLVALRGVGAGLDDVVACLDARRTDPA
jgi:phosphoribosyl-AMP cyclohydrolase / phosphoribosyl-ATP pyrophosphohydrolase